MEGTAEDDNNIFSGCEGGNVAQLSQRDREYCYFSLYPGLEIPPPNIEHARGS